MIDEINVMKKKLENLIITHDLNDDIVLETSCQLDKLILEYYSKEYNDLKLKFNDKDYKKLYNTK
ncbi:MAG: aspartyl-phosphate phosphatase Spo0E family protein [Tissierella sp.]|uniref:aspartyl-phosphate phosphatase Spo0E family protein n=1 Tax=Tissierella sp. TaxID=41274 RepID=UPI003F981F39